MERPRWFNITATVLLTLTALWLILGLFTTTGDLGFALFIEIFLPVAGAVIAILIVLYAFTQKSWRIFFLYGLSLAIAWILLWLAFD
jgi:hypothetical protein